MAKILSVHNLEPAAGADLSAYEAFLTEVAGYLRELETEGWRSYLVKGDRGERKARYAMVHEFDSAETRARYFPIEGGDASPEAQKQFFAPFEARGWVDRWNALVQGLDQDVYTDYVIVA